MRHAALCLALILIAGPALAAADKMQRSLEALEPATEMMEVCDIAVSAKISAETSYSQVDRVVADALKEPVADGDIFTATGGAFRDHGHWYGLRFICTLAPDHLSTQSLRYAVGNEIPESRWEEFGLWR
ncbi:DUF930 domain-containing protein [Terrihabitans soli]|nr:DUF930 domain-containing protein [Terrihabitans soli]